LRRGEVGQVIETFQRHLGMELRTVNASKEFLADLAGITDRRSAQENRCPLCTDVRGRAGQVARVAASAFLAQGTLIPT
jgi:GMP synthase (glutamine-hydrolysing)